MGLSGGPTNIFNALSSLSQGMQLRLHILALSGDSPVSNAFTEEADRLGLTVRGRERKERDAQRHVAEQMEAIRERTSEFSKRLDLLEQASTQALFESEKTLRAAREELKRVRDRAYEITMPDGTIAKVYRDGDRVRDDAGALVGPDIIRSEDIPEGFSTWDARGKSGDSAQRADEAYREIAAHHGRLGELRKRVENGDISDPERADMQKEIERMPDAVRKHLATLAPSQQKDSGAPHTNGDDASPIRLSVTKPSASFASAVSGLPVAGVTRSDDDFDADLKALPPSVSMSGPR